jgi:hypothetical protein
MSRYLRVIAASAATLVSVTTAAESQNLGAAAVGTVVHQTAHDWVNDGSRDRLVANVDALLGHARGNYIAMPPQPGIDEKLTVSQFNFAFKGIPGPMLNLYDGRKLFVGSAPHDADEKAIIVTEGDGTTIAGVALLHQSCFSAHLDKAHHKSEGCPVRPILTFLVPQRNSLNAQVKEDVVGWVKQVEQERSRASRSVPSQSRSIQSHPAFDVVVETLRSP